MAAPGGCESRGCLEPKRMVGRGQRHSFCRRQQTAGTNGTESECYNNCAWGSDGKVFSYPYNGLPYLVSPFSIGGRRCLYRWHMKAPLAFEKSIRFIVVHCMGNNRSDDF